MALKIGEIRDRAQQIARHPRTRKIAIWSVSIFIAIGVLLGLVTPPLIRGKVAAALSEKLHRQVSIEQIRINPYAMTLAIRGFLMKERQSQAAAVSFDELFVNLQFMSLFRLAPVIKELRLVKPYVNLVRNEDRKYNFQDLIDEFTGGPPGGPTPRFALNNIEVVGGKIDFDDRPEHTKHVIDQINIGVPFVSSLPSYVDIKVKPAFSAVINGAPFHLGGDTTPFKDSRDSTLNINIDKLKITKYLEYSPVKLNFTVPSGQLHGKLTASFRASQNNPSVLSIGGNLGLTDLDVQQTGGAPLVKLPSFEVLIDALQVFANKIALKSIKSQGLELHLNRGRDGKLNLANLVEVPTKPEAPEAKKESSPFGYSIDEIALESATIHIDDEQPQRPYKNRLNDVNVKITGLSNEPGKTANVQLSFESEGKEKFSHSGTMQMTPLLAEGKLDIEGLKIGALHPYYENALAADVKDGSLDISTQYSFAENSESKDIKLTELNATLRTLRLELAGQPAPLWRVTALGVKDASVDVGKKNIVIGAIEGKDGNGYIQRDADGTINLTRIAKSQGQAAAPVPAAKKSDDEWRIDVKKIDLERFKVDFEDRSTPAGAKTTLSEISLRGENFSTAKNQRGRTTIRTRINNKGLLSLVGTATVNPLNGKFTVDGRDIELVPFQNYMGDKVNLLLTGGQIGSKGELSFNTAADGGMRVNYQGSVRVADFGSVEKDGAQDLLKWKSLDLDAIQFDLEPFQLRIGEITLAEFYSRLILGADGKMNLQKLTVQPEEKKEETGAQAQPVEKPAPPPPDSATSPKAISIGKINLQSGNINFSDFFVKPNYSANLTSVEGVISELKPETPGDIDLKAKLDESAPVDIKGKINPLSKDLFLDIVADAREIELSPMTPYSAKYVGYGIEKGKLSFNVKYKLENRKLSAQNKIILNQLTFGEKIESPTATKLPVLLAVALLKDRNGVIDVDLPISGSLDDPQFSVGGIVLRIIINIITKAVTAPFSLIASAFGGGGSGEALSYIEFADGRATIEPSQREKIATLAKALNNRPALNLEITGRFDPVSDLDGLKRVGIERKVKAQKLKDLSRKGQAPRSVDEVQVDKGEYAQYLKAAYGEESFPKPRNIIGLAQDLPVPEMEKLMMQHAQVSDDDLRQLASQRAQAVRDALLASGQVGADRLFVVAAKPLSSEERAKLKGKPNRVDFAMK
ncbi:MAG TPA: DUF748 domain-containing protein [Candidatus Binatia bacterium]